MLPITANFKSTMEKMLIYEKYSEREIVAKSPRHKKKLVPSVGETHTQSDRHKVAGAFEINSSDVDCRPSLKCVITLTSIHQHLNAFKTSLLVCISSFGTFTSKLFIVVVFVCVCLCVCVNFFRCSPHLVAILHVSCSS